MILRPIFAWSAELFAGCQRWLAFCSVLLLSSALVQAADIRRAFDLPADAAENTLKIFSEQSGRGVVFSTDDVANVRTRAVRGLLSPRDAVDRMLVDSDLVAVDDPTSTALAIQRASLRPARSAPIGVNQPVPNSNGVQSDVLSLSPFIVTSEADAGYRATQTLAGSRLKTDLRDVGSAISVVTPEFIEDIGATDAKGILVYTLNTEVGGIGGNFAGGETHFNNVIQAPQRATRVRGLGSADLARNFYLTDIPFDTYNTSRVEIQRGSNAILFGLGSPAGIINNSLIGATFSNYTEFQAVTDTFGTRRGSFKVNREIVDQKLAVFAAGLYEKRKYEQHPAFEKNRRGYVAFTAQPARNTTLTASFEQGTIDANRPRPGPVLDYISPWYDYGKPIWNDATSSLQPPPAGRNNGLHGTPSSFLFGPGNIFFDPSSSQPTIGGHGLLNGATTGGRGSPTLGSFLPLQMLAVRYGVNGPLVNDENGNVVPRFGPDQAFYLQPSLMNTDAFNFRKILLDGPNSGQSADFNALNITLQQLAFDGTAGIELALDKQSHDTSAFTAFDSLRDYALYLDFNRVLLDGRLNPNFGGITTYATTNGVSTISNREALRATTFYNLDFRRIIRNERWAKILGTAVFTGLFNRQRIHSQSYEYRDTADPIVATLQPAVRSNPNLWTSSNLRALQVSGLAPGQTLLDLSKNQLSQVHIGGLTQRQVVSGTGTFNFWNQNTRQYEVREIPIYTQFNRPDLAATSGLKSTNKIDSIAFIAQNHFFSRNLVTTVGWRSDNVEIFDAGSAPLNPVFYNQRVDINARNWTIPSAPTLATRADVWSYSAVLHASEFIQKRLPLGMGLSLHYSESSNFQPSGRRIDIENNPIASPIGETTEHGFTVTLFDRKLYLKANWYETSQQNNNGAGNASLNVVSRILRQSLESVNAPQNAAFQVANLPVPSQTFLDVMGFTYDYANLTATENPSSQLSGSSDLISKGMEIELVYNPSPNLTFLLNVGQQKASRSNTSPATARFIESFVIPQFLNSEFAKFVITSIPNAPTVGDTTTSQVINPFRLAQLQDGGPVSELKEWQAALVTKYRFGTEAPRWARGWSIGAAVRWLDKSSIGFPVVFNADFDEYIQDVQNPWFGPADTKVDAWVAYERRLGRKYDWSIQLNLKNVLDDDELIPIATQPDGTIARVAVPEPFTWRLSTTLRF